MTASNTRGCNLNCFDMRYCSSQGSRGGRVKRGMTTLVASRPHVLALQDLHVPPELTGVCASLVWVARFFLYNLGSADKRRSLIERSNECARTKLPNLLERLL